MGICVAGDHIELVSVRHDIGGGRIGAVTPIDAGSEITFAGGGIGVGESRHGEWIDREALLGPDDRICGNGNGCVGDQRREIGRGNFAVRPVDSDRHRMIAGVVVSVGAGDIECLRVVVPGDISGGSIAIAPVDAGGEITGNRSRIGIGEAGDHTGGALAFGGADGTGGGVNLGVVNRGRRNRQTAGAARIADAGLDRVVAGMIVRVRAVGFESAVIVNDVRVGIRARAIAPIDAGAEIAGDNTRIIIRERGDENAARRGSFGGRDVRTAGVNRRIVDGDVAGVAAAAAAEAVDGQRQGVRAIWIVCVGSGDVESLRIGIVRDGSTAGRTAVAPVDGGGEIAGHGVGVGAGERADKSIDHGAAFGDFHRSGGCRDRSVGNGKGVGIAGGSAARAGDGHGVGFAAGVLVQMAAADFEILVIGVVDNGRGGVIAVTVAPIDGGSEITRGCGGIRVGESGQEHAASGGALGGADALGGGAHGGVVDGGGRSGLDGSATSAGDRHCDGLVTGMGIGVGRSGDVKFVGAVVPGDRAAVGARAIAPIDAGGEITGHGGGVGIGEAGDNHAARGITFDDRHGVTAGAQRGVVDGGGGRNIGARTAGAVDGDADCVIAGMGVCVRAEDNVKPVFGFDGAGAAGGIAPIDGRRELAGRGE